MRTRKLRAARHMTGAWSAARGRVLDWAGISSWDFISSGVRPFASGCQYPQARRLQYQQASHTHTYSRTLQKRYYGPLDHSHGNVALV